MRDKYELELASARPRRRARGCARSATRSSARATRSHAAERADALRADAERCARAAEAEAAQLRARVAELGARPPSARAAIAAGGRRRRGRPSAAAPPPWLAPSPGAASPRAPPDALLCPITLAPLRDRSSRPTASRTSGAITRWLASSSRSPAAGVELGSKRSCRTSRSASSRASGARRPAPPAAPRRRRGPRGRRRARTLRRAPSPSPRRRLPRRRRRRARARARARARDCGGPARVRRARRGRRDAGCRASCGLAVVALAELGHRRDAALARGPARRRAPHMTWERGDPRAPPPRFSARRVNEPPGLDLTSARRGDYSYASVSAARHM